MSITDVNSKETLASHYALQVALQTMKERCQNLQHRLTTVEDENLRLRMISGIDKPENTNNNEINDKFGINEIEILRNKVAELTRQKVQLTEHISMVATENRQLWSRLSKLTKDNQNLGSSLNKIKDTIIGSTGNNALAANCLVRSKTFTQNSPSPMLRHKINSTEYEEYEEETGTNTKSNDDKQECSSLENTIGFGYLQDQEINDDTMQNIKRITDAFQEFKKEILWQQCDLKLLLSNLQKRKDSEKQKQQQNQENLSKSVKVDKCLETDPILLKDTDDTDNAVKPKIASDMDEQINLFKQKIDQENVDKMCPMCGKLFSKNCTFNTFQEHVESHFIDDSETDYNSIEKNYEIVSHTVGQF